jgi:hypothetical protein
MLNCLHITKTTAFWEVNVKLQIAFLRDNTNRRVIVAM